jgi:hypothetical protein
MADTVNPKKVAAAYDKDKTPGIKLDPGPYIGIVKNNVDPARIGRLQVYIADLGGDENDPSSWWTVTYASPFFGSTIGSGSDNDSAFGTEQQTYGFWAVPPDLQNQVLITFVMGDASRGFWFACIPNVQSQHMIPAISRPSDESDINYGKGFDKDRGLLEDQVYLPASEINLNNGTRDKQSDYLRLDRVAHNYQANIVIEQGLETDPIRGTVSSSSQRESPSAVFGFSTPGRPDPDLVDDFPDREALDKHLDLGQQGTKIQDIIPTKRKGGHTFVMDDGDVYGDSKLIRLRSSGGHQILMHDTENIIYIGNANGTAWVEFTAKGDINIYSGDSLSIRSEMDINFHADRDINLHAGGTLKMYAGESILSQTSLQLITAKDLYNINAGVVGIRSGGSIDVKALNSSWTTAGLMNMKNGSMTITSAGKTTISSGATSGWKVSGGELWFKGGDQVYINTEGKVVPDATTPVDPEVNPNMDLFRKTNVRYDPVKKRWVIDRNSGLESINPFTPTHEPWPRETGNKKLSSGLVEPSQGQGV